MTPSIIPGLRRVQQKPTENPVFFKKTKKRLPVWAASLLCAIFWLAVWEGLALLVGKEVLLPSPFVTVKRIAELSVTSGFWLSCALSMLRIALGFLLAVAAGALIALLTAFVPFLRTLFSPALSVIKATPVASFIVLALVWMKSGTIPVFTSFLMVLPVVWSNAHAGLLSVDRDLLEMTRVYRLSRAERMKKLYLPSALPYFTAACGTGAGLAWKAGIAAEVLSRTAFSIGREIYDSKIYLETVDLFAWTAVLIVISVAFERLILLWLRKANRRFSSGDGNAD